MWESSPSDAGLYGVTGRASISWQRGGRSQAGRWVYPYLAPMSAASASWQTRASPTQTTGIPLSLPCHCRLRHGYRCDTLYHSIVSQARSQPIITLKPASEDGHAHMQSSASCSFNLQGLVRFYIFSHLLFSLY